MQQKSVGCIRLNAVWKTVDIEVTVSLSEKCRHDCYNQEQNVSAHVLLCFIIALSKSINLILHCIVIV